MIKGVHTMFWGFPFTDVGDEWLIFDLPEADMGCHPAGTGDGERAGAHHISFYCDDLERTVQELASRGVEFTDGVSDAGYGLTTHFRMPGEVEVELYQPHYRKRPR